MVRFTTLIFALTAGVVAAGGNSNPNPNPNSAGGNPNIAPPATTSEPKICVAEAALGGTPPLNLYQIAQKGEQFFPKCGDLGQNESFQGAPLNNTQGVCKRVNICHGNAGFGWNRITVDRSAIGVDNPGNGGHAKFEHNDPSNPKREDFFPGGYSVPNPYGAGKNGYLDSMCNFVSQCPASGDPPPVIPGEDTGAACTVDSECNGSQECNQGYCLKKKAPGTPGAKTAPPVTQVPTQAPVTPAPVTPVTQAPVTPAPVTPVSQAPVTPAPAPITDSPVENTPPAPDADPTGDGADERAFTRGDPHFKTFGGELYDYHGQCDMVLLSNPKFKNGLGMTVHIRTKIQDFWSSVESAAIKIGDDFLEIAGGEGKEWLWVNGEANEDLEEQTWYRTSLAGFLVRFKQTGAVREANIYLEGKEVLVMKTYHDFVRVDINWVESENYEGSVGLLGAKDMDGVRVGRDGNEIKNVNAFGQEWQVKEDEDKLFHNYDSSIVQAPAKCVLPPSMTDEKVALRQRRLAESNLTVEKAEKACEHVQGSAELKACVYDILATQDINMAGAW